MKSKVMMWGLSVAVAGVWGLIAYRIWVAASSGDTPVPRSVTTTGNAFRGENLSDIDTATLFLNYRDPFSGTPAPSAPALPAPAPASLPARPPQLVLTPEMASYKGYIINPANKRVVSVIVINSKEHMMMEGETIESLTLLKNMRDSVRVNYRGSLRVLQLR